MLKDVSLGAMSIFSSLLAIVAAARLLPQDIEDRTVYAILAKPVPRFEYVTRQAARRFAAARGQHCRDGRAVRRVALFSRDSPPRATSRGKWPAAPPEQLAAALRELRAATFNANLLPAIAVIFLKASVCSPRSRSSSRPSRLRTSSRSSSRRSSTSSAICRRRRASIGCRSKAPAGCIAPFSAVVALVFPDLHLFDFADEIVAGADDPADALLRDGRSGLFLHR